MSMTNQIFTVQSHPTSTAHRTSSASLLYGPPHFYGAIKTAKTIITPKGRKGRHLFIVRPQWEWWEIAQKVAVQRLGNFDAPVLVKSVPAFGWLHCNIHATWSTNLS